MTDEQVVDTYGPMVYRIAKNYLKTSFDADDVYSETSCAISGNAGLLSRKSTAKPG